MPFLSGEDRAQMEYDLECDICKKHISRRYCSRCDEFFWVGHKEDCQVKGDIHDVTTCGGDRGYR